jgi:hypothetical protein
MSDSKTAKPVQFPVHNEGPPKRPAWLEDGHGAPVRKLFELDEEPNRALAPNEHPARPSEMPPSAANTNAPPAPQQPAAAAAQRAAEAAAQRAVEAAAAKPEHTDAADADPDERAYSKLPPPPRLGSLIPGARSAPPPAPANDVSPELLLEQREAFTNAALELASARAASLSVLEGQLLDLSIEIAEALIEREVSEDPTLHSTLARAALASIGDSDRVTLRTSPDAFEAICQTLGGPETTVNGVHVTVHADATIPGLGCVVDGENVRIDATVTERLRAVRRAFHDQRRKAAESSE